MNKNDKDKIKYIKSMYKTINKYCKTLGNDYYTKDKDEQTSCYIGCKSSNKVIYIRTKERSLYDRREEIVDVLKDINYKRNKQEWSASVVIGLIHEVIEVNTQFYSEDEYNKITKAISNRYNVPVNRLTSQVATFLNNMDRCGDKYDIGYYFSTYDLFMWKYRTPEKLNKAVEEDKLSEKEKEILKEIYDL